MRRGVSVRVRSLAATWPLARIKKLEPGNEGTERGGEKTRGETEKEGRSDQPWRASRAGTRSKRRRRGRWAGDAGGGGGAGVPAIRRERRRQDLGGGAGVRAAGAGRAAGTRGGAAHDGRDGLRPRRLRGPRRVRRLPLQQRGAGGWHGGGRHRGRAAGGVPHVRRRPQRAHLRAGAPPRPAAARGQVLRRRLLTDDPLRRCRWRRQCQLRRVQEDDGRRRWRQALAARAATRSTSRNKPSKQVPAGGSMAPKTLETMSRNRSI